MNSSKCTCVQQLQKVLAHLRLFHTGVIWSIYSFACSFTTTWADNGRLGLNQLHFNCKKSVCSQQFCWKVDTGNFERKKQITKRSLLLLAQKTHFVLPSTVISSEIMKSAFFVVNVFIQRILGLITPFVELQTLTNISKAKWCQKIPLLLWTWKPQSIRSHYCLNMSTHTS